MENEHSSSAMGMSHSSGQTSQKRQKRRGSMSDRDSDRLLVKKSQKLLEKSKRRIQRDLETLMVNPINDENLAKESKKVRFTEEEDEEIIRLIKQHGKKWRLISELMNGKNQTRIRNRYYSRLREVLGETGVNGSEENEEEEEDERSSDVRESIQIKQEDQKYDDCVVNENGLLNESGHFRHFKSMNQLQLQDSDMKMYQQFDEISPLAKNNRPDRYHIGSFNHFQFESSPIHYQQDLLFQTRMNQENPKLKYQLHSLPCLDKNISFSELQDSLIEEPPLGDYVTKQLNHNYAELNNNIAVTPQPDDSINNSTIAKRRDIQIPSVFRPNAFLLQSSDGFLDEPSPLIFQKQTLLATGKGNNYDQMQEDRQCASFNVEEDKIGFRDMCQGEAENDDKYQYYSQEDQLQFNISNQEKLQKIQFLNKQILFISQMLEQCRQQIAKELMIQQISNQV